MCFKRDFAQKLLREAKFARTTKRCSKHLHAVAQKLPSTNGTVVVTASFSLLKALKVFIKYDHIFYSTITAFFPCIIFSGIHEGSAADPGFLLGGGAPLRNGVTDR